ncbi:MAG: hypothetical protein NWS92_08385 [Crocinitomicaceae bacterium]|nr:hypothetical protein [Crocinitomicaceae bacterium]
MKRFILSLALLSWSSSQAQLSFEGVYLQNGAFFGASKGSVADFQTLAPQSVLLQQDLTPYQTYAAMNFNFPGQSQSLSVGLKMAKLPNATLRLGLMHTNQRNALTVGGSYTETFRVDTLTSSQTGEQFFVDSFSTHSYNASYSQEQLRLDASLLFRYNADKRWSFYGGIGANFGLSYNAQTSVNQYVSPYGSEYGYGLFNDIVHNGTHTQETFENKGGFGFGVYAPLGVDFQVGKKRDFWMPIHLYMELRPGFNVNQIAGLGTSFSAGNFSNVGLRFQMK